MGIPLTLSLVPATTPYVQYVSGNGQTIFPYPFPITQDSDLVVVVNGVTQPTDGGYSLLGQGNPTGGNVTFNSGQTAGAIITLFRNIAIQRISQIAQNSGFSSTVFNAEFNNIYLILQQLQESIALCLQIPNTNNPAPTTTLLPGTYANKYLAFDSNGNPTPALLTSSGTITQALIGSLLYPRANAEISASIVPTNLYYPPGNVLRYGADPTGAIDSTYAFQQACLSTWSGYDPIHPPWQVVIPGGRYKLAGANTGYNTPTVWVRSGMTVMGAGMGSTIIDASLWGASTNDLFRLGWGYIGGTATQDAGGEPVEIAEMFMLGGPSGGGANVAVKFPGCLVHDIWFSAAGMGVWLQGGYVYNCEFDLGLVGMTLSGGASDQTVTNCRFYNQSSAQLQFDTTASADLCDLIINGCMFEFPQTSSLIAGGGGTISYRGIKVVNCDFLSNVQYAGYSGFLNIATTNTFQAEFDSCTFRNMPGAAAFVASSNAIIDFKHCVFDGAKTNSAYALSTTSAAVSVSAGTARLTNCQYRNLAANNAITISGSGAVNVRLNGVQYSGNNASGALINITNSSSGSQLFIENVDGDGVQQLLNAQSVFPVRMKNCFNWWGSTQVSGGSNYVTVPYQTGTAYQVTLTANVNAGGNANYSKTRSDFVEKNNDFAAGPVFTSYISQTTAFQSAANGNGTLTLTAAFDAVGGGASVTPLRNSGVIAVSWPNTYSSVQLDIQPINSAVA